MLPLCFKVCDLHQGKTYVFRVRAVNASGVGLPSDASEPVLVEARPGELQARDGRRAPSAAGACWTEGRKVVGGVLSGFRRTGRASERSRYSGPWSSARLGGRGLVSSERGPQGLYGSIASIRGDGGLLAHCWILIRKLHRRW